MSKIGLVCAVLICLIVWDALAGAQTQSAAGATAAGATAAGPIRTATATTTAVAPPPAAAANPQTPEEFFARARQLSDLEASGIPFHLKATFVASGKTEFTGNGTYEEWWQSKDEWRKEATLGDYKYVAVENCGKLSLYGTADYVPLRLRQAMDAVLIRIPADAGTSHKWKMAHKKMSGADFVILSNTDPCVKDGKNVQGGGVECVTQNFFTTDGVLRIHAAEAQIVDLYNDLQPFHHALLVARSVTEAVDGVTILTLSITSIEPLGASATILSQATPSPANLQMIESTTDMTAKAKVTKSKLIREAKPTYPRAAELTRIQGTVVIDASIDGNGKVREPYVIVSAGALLDDAALDAVRQWRYDPTTLNGIPVSIETTISVVFRLQ